MRHLRPDWAYKNAKARHFSDIRGDLAAPLQKNEQYEIVRKGIFSIENVDESLAAKPQLRIDKLLTNVISYNV